MSDLYSRASCGKYISNYSDRILFGTDISKINLDNVRTVAERYNRCFQLLETDNVVQGGFFGKEEIKGLVLPQDALEKIYFRNAIRIYPRVRDVLEKLGYEKISEHSK